MGDDIYDNIVAALVIIYLLGVPVSFGVSVKMAEPPAALFIAPVWPAVALGYVGYRLAP